MLEYECLKMWIKKNSSSQIDNRNGRIQVVFLLRAADHRWKEHASSFLRSYMNFSPGIAHRLIIVLKGFNDPCLAEPRSIFSCVDHDIILLSDLGLDLQTYFETARLCDSGPICFLNSHSHILCSDWLAKLVEALSLDDIGLAGATGSFERQHLDHFPPFPNAHLRTTCFIISRDELLNSHSTGFFTNKNDAYIFESGYKSLTRHIRNRGWRVCVVGRNGKIYDPEEWPHSGTFRQGNQRNLLVSDNQTRHYRDADRETKKTLSMLAWGKDRTTKPWHRLFY